MRHAACAIVALVVLLAYGHARPVAAQEVERPSRCANWQLTGRWAAATTEAGRNSSLAITTLHLVQRGDLLVGRWTPLEGREVAVEGTVAAGIARLTFFKPDAPRKLVLSIGSDGTRIGGRWTEPGTAGGEFWARGEASCPLTPTPPEPALSGPSNTSCLAWDVTGQWAVGWPTGGDLPGNAPGPGTWTLHLWQDQQDLVGWYQSTDRSSDWPVDGTVRGRRLTLSLRLEESLWVERNFILASHGRSARARWPIDLGAIGAEVITGQATCTARNAL
ncbi:MAG: hypothetical protein CL878_13280 [Dehalococcoidia bacterium]|nr:hypothetical protein [Dehalococcoidia bacterium]